MKILLEHHLKRKKDNPRFIKNEETDDKSKGTAQIQTENGTVK